MQIDVKMNRDYEQVMRAQQATRRKSELFPALKSQPELDLENARRSGRSLSPRLFLCACVALISFGLGTLLFAHPSAHLLAKTPGDAIGPAER